MKLQKKVFITDVLFFIVFAIFTALSFYIVAEVKETTTELDSAAAIAVRAAHLEALFANYYIDRNEAARQKWAEAYRQLGATAAKAKFDTKAERVLLAGVIASYNATGKSFQAFLVSKNKVHSQAVIDASKNMVFYAFRLRRSNASYMIGLHQKSFVLVICAVAAAAIILVANLLLIVFRIVRPVVDLNKGVELVGSGALTYRVGNSADDEIGDLSRAFDAMAVNLQKTALRYKTIFESVIDGFCVIDVEGKFIEVSKSFCAMTGHDEQELLNKRLSDLEADSSRQNIEACFKDVLTGAPVCYELKYRRKDNTFVDFETSIQNLRGEDMLVVFFHDITERKRSEGQLAQYRLHLEQMVAARTQELEAANHDLKRLNQVKSDFVSMVSHELRTPLTPIREAMSLMYDGIAGEVSEKQRHFLEIGLRNIDRLARLINDLLDISRIEAGRLDLVVEPFDITEVVKNVANTFGPLAEKKGLKIDLGDCVVPVLVNADKDKTLQVFDNIIGNAIKFTEQGLITIRVKIKPAFAECSVADTGKGVSSENLGRLFNKFEQFNRSAADGEKGTGLGLSISKGIIEAQGGRIWAQSVLDKGSVFFFTIPLYNEEQVNKEGVL